MSTLLDQLEQVLALSEKATQGIWETRDSLGFGYLTIAAVGDPDGLCINLNSPANAKAVAAAVNLLREHGPAIRAAVGGEAEPVYQISVLGGHFMDVPKHRYDIAPNNPELTRRVLYASPTATVDVGAGKEALAIIDKWMESYDHMGTGTSADARMSEREWEEDRAKLAALIGEK